MRVGGCRCFIWMRIAWRGLRILRRLGLANYWSRGGGAWWNGRLGLRGGCRRGRVHVGGERGGGPVVVVEWGEGVGERMGAGTIHVRLEPVGETARRITIEDAPEK